MSFFASDPSQPNYGDPGSAGGSSSGSNSGGWTQFQQQYIAALAANGKLNATQTQNLLASGPGGYSQAVYPSLNANDLAQLGISTTISPQFLVQVDTLSPALSAGVAAPAATITAMATVVGASLPPFTVPSGRNYRIRTSKPRPTNPGGTFPVLDSTVICEPACSEALQADGSRIVTITPRWLWFAIAPAAAIAVSAASVLTSNITAELI